MWWQGEEKWFDCRKIYRRERKKLDAQTLGAVSLGTGTTGEKTIIAAPSLGPDTDRNNNA